MVTLRERNNRPSYAIKAGIVSDESSGGDDDDEQAAGPSRWKKSRHGHGSDDEGADQDEIEASSLSSGGTDEFRPSPAKSGPTGGNGDDDEGDSIEVDEDDDEDALVPVDDEDGDSFMDDKSAIRAKAKSKSKAIGTPRSAKAKTAKVAPRISAMGSASDTPRRPVALPKEDVPLPGSYAQLVRTTMEALSRPPPRRAGVDVYTDPAAMQAKFLYHQPPGVEGLPIGLPVPYSIRLAEDPASGSAPANIVIVPQSKNSGGQSRGGAGALGVFGLGEDDDMVDKRRNERQERAWAVAKKMNAGPPPWQTWEGEGWWPEMVQKPAEQAGDGQLESSGKGKHKGKGKGKESADAGGAGRVKQEPQGWIRREQVRIGLDDVGRYTVAELSVLSAPEARKYLPRDADQIGRPGVKIQLGPYESQKQYHLTMFSTHALRESNPHSLGGFLLAAGGPVWGLDWAPCPDHLTSEFDYEQYLAVAPLPSLDTPSFIGDTSSTGPTCIQIWAVRPDQPAKPAAAKKGNGSRAVGGGECLVVMCVDEPGAFEIKWMPLGAWDETSSNDKIPKLGILAAVQLDGTVSFYSVPNPRTLRTSLKSKDGQPVFIRSKALLRLHIYDATALCLDWITGSRLVVGLSNGHVAIYDIAKALISKTPNPPPLSYIHLAMSGIRSITCAHVPPDRDYTSESPYLCFASLEGTTGMLDIRDPTHIFEMGKARSPATVVAWSAPIGIPLFTDVENALISTRMRPGVGPRGFTLTTSRGPVWDIGTSDYHTTTVMAGADGSVMLVSGYTGIWRKKKVGYVSHRWFEVDYDEISGEYRMLDTFNPERSGDTRETLYKAPGGSYPEGNPNAVNTGIWAPQVGVHRATWQNGAGIGRAGWLATAGGNGLVRVEWVEGRFRNGDVPDEL